MDLLWFIVVGFLLILLEVAILGVSVLKRVTYTREFEKERCYAGDQLVMTEKIANEKRLSIPWLRLEAMMPASFSFQTGEELGISKGNIYQNHQSLFTMKPFTKISRRHFVICQNRGIFQMESVTMTGGDLLNLFSTSRKLPVTISLIVYPSILADHEMPSNFEVWQGELEVSRWIVEDPFLIVGVRPYGASDPMNRIHWSATARTGELQVFKQGFSSDPQTMILYNIQESEDMWSVVTRPELAEKGLSYAATAVSYAAGRGLKTGFAHNAYSEKSDANIRIDADYGSIHAEYILQAMAEVQLKCLMPMEQMLRNEADRQEAEEVQLDYLLITAYVSSAMEVQLTRLRSTGNRVTVLFIENEGGENE
ncbi:DUF58 domain-containing protein [Paenibacillus sp. Marseille-Q4541]|uniref:DUF58 domain-containing protein n=1 Tax=Paenibacillus sp. Marseille-Q4541 TaxID=2831522 RepID=UPI001BA893DB|nr:DUF58 domain-containing protein [Paenibacillus sp. Marseille-Q4541]